MNVIFSNRFRSVLKILTAYCSFLQTFSLKFKAAWAKDGYRSYLEQDSEVCHIFVFLVCGIVVLESVSAIQFMPHMCFLTVLLPF